MQHVLDGVAIEEAGDVAAELDSQRFPRKWCSDTSGNGELLAIDCASIAGADLEDRAVA